MAAEQQFFNIVDFVQKNQPELYEALNDIEAIDLLDLSDGGVFINPHESYLKKIIKRLTSNNSDDQVKGLKYLKSLIIPKYYKSISDVNKSFENMLGTTIKVDYVKEDDEEKPKLIIKLNGAEITDNDNIVFKKKNPYKIFNLLNSDIPMSDSSKSKKVKIQEEKEELEDENDEDDDKKEKTKKSSLKSSLKQRQEYNFDSYILDVLSFKSDKNISELEHKYKNFILKFIQKLEEVSKENEIARSLLIKLKCIVDECALTTIIIFFEPELNKDGKLLKRMVESEAEHKIVFDILKDLFDSDDEDFSKSLKKGKPIDINLAYDKLLARNPIVDRQSKLHDTLVKKIINIRATSHSKVELPSQIYKAYSELRQFNTIGNCSPVLPDYLLDVYKRHVNLKLIHDEVRFRIVLFIMNNDSILSFADIRRLFKFVRTTEPQLIKQSAENMDTPEFYSIYVSFLLSNFFLYVPYLISEDDDVYISKFDPQVRNKITHYKVC